MSLLEIQKKLKAPKSQWNDFNKFNYRSCEDIVEAVKPLLAECGYHLIMTDSIHAAGPWVYVCATARVYDGIKMIAEAQGFAREPESKKGMDSSQITGAASSYARKYALNGLFAIDDAKDADALDNRSQQQLAGSQGARQGEDKPWYNDFENDRQMMHQKILNGERTAQQILDNLSQRFKVNKQVRQAILDLENTPAH